MSVWVDCDNVGFFDGVVFVWVGSSDEVILVDVKYVVVSYFDVKGVFFFIKEGFGKNLFYFFVVVSEVLERFVVFGLD